MRQSTWIKNEKSEKMEQKAYDWGYEPSPLHLQRFKSQHYENLSSTSTLHSPWAAPALPVSSTRTTHELHRLHSPFLPHPVLGPCHPWFRWSFCFITHSFYLHPAVSLSSYTVGKTLPPMLPTAVTTVGSWRKPFNRPRSISLFSSLPLETA